MFAFRRRMATSPRWSTAVALLLLAGATACDDGAGPEPSVSDLTVTVELLDTQVMSGEVLVAMVQLHNPGPGRVAFPVPCFPLTVRISRGPDVVYPVDDTMGCSIPDSHGSARMVLEHDEIVSWVVLWRAETNHGTSTRKERVPLPAGEYTLVAGVPGEDRSLLAVSSEPVSFLVVEL